MFGNKVQLGKCVSNNITVCDQVVERSKVIWYLDGWFDESLHMNTHVNKKCQAASWNLKQIRMVRSQLDRESCEILTCNVVLSHLDYVNSNLFGIHKYLLNRMQRVQNWAAKIVLNVQKQCNSVKCLHELHWFPIVARIEYKILTIVHKCLNDNKAPVYLKNLLIHSNQINSGICAGQWLNDSEHILIVPYAKYKAFGRRAFSVYALRLWNHQPIRLQNISRYEHFKVQLKTFLFVKYVVNKLD